MADSPKDLSWPASVDDLVDTHRCPGCFTTIVDPLCPVCGFVVTDPRALEVLALGRSIQSYEEERQRIIEEVRLKYRPASVVAAVDLPAPVVAASAVAELAADPEATDDADSLPWELQPEPGDDTTPALVPATVSMVISGEPASPSVSSPAQPTFVPAAPPREPRPPRRRLSVPVLLLIVGVSLVGIAAIFFLVYAWFAWGILVRALIIGAITVATIVIASLLKRRSLTATAEGIAVLGVLLLGLDAWALRANDFFGSGQIPGTLYAGIGVLVVGVLARIWARLSKLRSPDIASVIAIPVGLGLLVAGATTLPFAQAAVAGLLGAAAGGLSHALPTPLSSARARVDAVPERLILVLIGVASLVLAALTAAFVSPGDIALPLWSGGAIIVLGAAHALLLRPRDGVEALPAANVTAGVASSTAAAVAATIGWQLAVRTELPVFTMLLGPVIAVAVAVVVDRLRPRVAGLVPALITSGVVAGLSILTALVLWVVGVQVGIAGSWWRWETDPFAVPPAQADGAMLAAVGGVVIAALLFFAPTLGSTALLRNLRIVVATVLVLCGVAVIAVPALLVGVAALAAAMAIFLLTKPVLRPGAGVAASIAAITAFSVGTTTPWLWVVGIAVAIGAPIAAQAIVRPSGTPAALLTATPIAVAVVAAFMTPEALGTVTRLAPDVAASFVLVQWIAVVSALGAVVLRCSPASRTTLAVSAYVLFALSLTTHVIDAARVTDTQSAGPQADGALGVAMVTVLGEPVLAVVRMAILLALFTVIALRRTRVEAIPSLGAALLSAPAAAATTFAVLQTLGLEGHDARALATVGAAITVVWVAAVWSLLRPAEAAIETRRISRSTVAPITRAAAATATDDVNATAIAAPAVTPVKLPRGITRLLVDVGATATVLTLASDHPLDLRWVMMAVIAAGFGALSVTRGWAAPLTAQLAGVPSIRGEGVPLAEAPRRLFAWPAFGFATVALWLGLSASSDGRSLSVEAYVIPPAVGLLVFTALLIWLRRHIEASIALAASFSLGLGVLAITALFGSSVRGIIVALVAAVICLLLTCTPALRARTTALTGATVAFLALSVAIAAPSADEPPATMAWLFLLVGVAYVSAFAAARQRRLEERRSWYATIIPPLSVVFAVLMGVLEVQHPAVLTIAFVSLGALHIAAAGVDRAPLGSGTRWTTMAGSALFALMGYQQGVARFDETTVVELVSLPVALTLLAGSAVAQWRRHRANQPASTVELWAWLGGIVIAVLPSIVAPVEPLRVWLVVGASLLIALVIVLVPFPAIRSLHTLRTGSAIILTSAALVMGARTLLAHFEGGADAGFAEVVAIVASLGALVVAGAMVGKASGTALAGTGLAAAAAALALVTVLVTSDGELTRTTITAIVAAVVGVAGAALLGLERWRGFGGVLAGGGLVASFISIGARFAEIEGTASSSIEPDGWALVALAITAAVGIMALRATAPTPVAHTVGTVVGAAFAVALVLFTVAEAALLSWAPTDGARTVFTMTALTVVGVGGMLWRPRLGLALPITAAGAALVFGLVALFLYAVAPTEAVTVPPALGLLFLGARTLRRNPESRTWPALGPGLALLLVPSLLHDFGDNEVWRLVALGVVAIAVVVIGAVWRLQAPLVLGSVVLLIHGVAQLWPWISGSYVYVPWWLWLGIGGVLLIFLAARYEKNMRAVKSAFTAVTSLR